MLEKVLDVGSRNNRIKLSSTSTHLFYKCLHAAANTAVEHTLRKCSPYATAIEQQTIYRRDLFFLFNDLNIFPMNANSLIRVLVQKKYFFEFKFKFEFGKMIEFFRVQVRNPGRNTQSS